MIHVQIRDEAFVTLQRGLTGFVELHNGVCVDKYRGNMAIIL